MRGSQGSAQGTTPTSTYLHIFKGIANCESNIAPTMCNALAVCYVDMGGIREWRTLTVANSLSVDLFTFSQGQHMSWPDLWMHIQ